MMKISLIWGVFGLIWGSGFVLADREFYPGINYDITSLRPAPVRLQSYLPETSYYDIKYKRLRPTWQRRSLPMNLRLEPDDVTEYLERTEPDTESDYEKLVNLYKLLQYARNQLGWRLPQLTGRRAELIKNLEEKYAKLKQAASINDVDFLEKYVLNPPPEEARMYPQEDADGDLSWTEESGDKIYSDTDEHIPSISEQERLHYENALYGKYGKMRPTYNVHENIMNIEEKNPDKENKETHVNQHQTGESHKMHGDHENYVFKANEVFPTSDIGNIPIAEDPSEFGYGPSDPRFFEKNNEEISGKINEHETTEPNNIQKPKLLEQPQKAASPKLKERYKTKLLTSNHEQTRSNENFIGSGLDVVAVKKPDISSETTGIYIIAVVAGISAAATVGLIAVGIGWYNLQKHMKNAEDTDYPSYGIVGPNKDYDKKHRDEAGDRKLTQSAQMYHYQHQKQQIIAMGRNHQGHGSMSDTDEEEDEEGNYTVYECPGLASIEGPLEVKNPMFDDDQLATPSQTPSKPTNENTSK